MKILVTGGSGFIGTNLVEFYSKLGHTVLNLDIAEPRNSQHIGFWRKCDINQTGPLLEFVKSYDPEFCFHMAARTDLLGKNMDDYRSNTVGVGNVVRALTQCNSLKFTVFASSMLVCRIGYIPAGEQDTCPSNFYGQSKVIGEQVVRDNARGLLNYVVVRPTSIWGPWFASPYKDFFNTIRKGLYFHPHGLRIRRSYGFVYNTVLQLDKLREVGGGSLSGKVIYIADYDPIELLEWGKLIQRRFKVRPIKEVPLALFRIGAVVGDILNKIGVHGFPLSRFRLRNMLTETVHDMSPLRSVTGSLRYSHSEGVDLTCQWIESVDRKC